MAAWTTRTSNGFRNYAPSAATMEKRRLKAIATLEAAGAAEAWAIYEKFNADPDAPYEERVIASMVAKLARWGNITEKTMNYLKVLVAKIPEREKVNAERAEARAAEVAAAAPVPVTEGRVKVEGEVISVKERDGRFGPTLKMLIKTPAGYKLWGTVPTAINTVERGAKVEFEATVTRSDKDEKFGFFARPSKARVLNEEKREEIAA